MDFNDYTSDIMNEMYNNIMKNKPMNGNMNMPDDMMDKPMNGNMMMSDGMMNKNCMPQPIGALPKYMPIGMAYVPFQEWEKPYDDNIALSRGTIFPSLDKPFLGKEANQNARKG